MHNFFLVILFLLSACTFKKKELLNQLPEGHEELYSMPKSVNESVPEGFKRIVIASTNDIEGHFGPQTVEVKDKHSPALQNISVGGVDIISSYYKILREHYKNVVLVDSGDIFPDDTNQIKRTSDFYSSLKYSALTVGLRDFSLKVPEGLKNSSELVKNFSKDSEVPLLLSNLFELKTGRSVEWKGTKPYQIIEIDGLKVGILGLVPDDLVDLTPVDNRVGLYVESMLEATLRHARLMRSLGAQLIVVMAHQGIECGENIAAEANLPLNKVNFEPTKENVCNTTSNLGKYLERLPPKLVDVVIGGRNHKKAVNFVNGTLVMSGFEHGKSFNFAEFYIDSKTNKVVPEKTVAHQPVMFCREFFKESHDCFYEDASIDHREKIPATFLGKPVESDLDLKTKFNSFFEETNMSFMHEVDVPLNLKKFKAHITYLPESSFKTQLMILEIEGKKLLKILEEDFHQEEKIHWKPNPFTAQNDVFKLMIENEKISPEENYKVLVDLESLQTRSDFHKFIKDNLASSRPTSSWIHSETMDVVDSQLAAPQRQ